MPLNLSYNHPKYSDASLNASIHSILTSNTLLSMATVRENMAYANTAYFCFSGKLEVFVLSEPSTKHSQNLLTNKSVALAIYDSHQPWTDDKKGLQLFGTCEMATGFTLVEAVSLYLKRFTGLGQWVSSADDILRGAINSKFYVIQVSSLKLFDESSFDKEEFITLVPSRLG